MVTPDEVEATLKGFAKDKSPRPDRWTVEFYLHFFDLWGMELVKAIEDTRCSGVIPYSLNNTYLTLIPKLDQPGSFNDYKLIALCNQLYKFITKIIAERMNNSGFYQTTPLAIWLEQHPCYP